ncbi:MAG: glycine--tRNA ligase [Candidatus Hadarchaeota archaeon]
MKQQDVMELALRRGFIWPAFEIYGGLGGFYDYGPLGAALKNKIIEKWRSLYVLGEGFLEVDSPTVTPEEVLKASGHVEHFVDAMVECKKCGAAFKATDIAKEETGKDIEGMGREEMNKFIRERGVKCQECGGGLGEIFDFNAMFKTAIGPGSKRVGYLRPETAQGIFINFKRLQRLARGRLPFGVVQIGKGYRNEISPRQGMIRLREFTMAEAEVFFDPEDPRHPNFERMAGEKLRLWQAEDQADGKENFIEVAAGEAVEKKMICNQLMAYYMALTKIFIQELGIPAEAIRFREQGAGQRSHYSSETWDAEIMTKRFGWIEVTGIAYRTDYDLSRHIQQSGEDLTAFAGGKKVVCHVVEPSYGIDRPFYCLLEHAYFSDGKRSYLKLKKGMAPVQAGVFPLQNKDGLPEKASELCGMLRCEGLVVGYDDSGSIGRRYLRADEVGTPYCVTVDYRTLEDDTVTLRERDTTAQVRLPAKKLPETINSLICGKISFESAGEPVKA